MGCKDWDNMDIEEQVEALREKLNSVIEFVDNHKHNEDGFVHSQESIYGVVKGSL